MSDLRNFLSSLATALEEHDGVGAAEWLSVKHDHADNKRLVQQISAAQVGQVGLMAVVVSCMSLF